MRKLVACALVVGCSSPPAPSSVAPPADALGELAVQIGDKPRVIASFALNEPVLREYLDGIEEVPPLLGGRTFADCGVAFANLRQLRLAVGEPLVIAAELDGITSTEARCILGDALTTQLLDGFGFELRDRAGGISLRSARTASETRTPAIDALARACVPRSGCVALALGPARAPLRVEASIEGPSLTWRFSGPGFSQPAADRLAAAAKAVATEIPAFSKFIVRSAPGVLTATFVDAQNEELRRLLKEHLVEALRMPSTSMVPTLLVGDNIFVAKGSLRGPIEPGVVVVHRGEAGRLYVKRVIAIGGQVVRASPAGLSIDGEPLATDLVDAAYRYRDQDPETGKSLTLEGKRYRERLGGRTHQIVRMHDGTSGEWQVPEGHYFVVGDNRESSNDSRFYGAVPADAVVGRVLGIWLATRGDAPDWDRMGTGID